MCLGFLVILVCRGGSASNNRARKDRKAKIGSLHTKFILRLVHFFLDFIFVFQSSIDCLASNRRSFLNLR